MFLKIYKASICRKTFKFQLVEKNTFRKKILILENDDQIVSVFNDIFINRVSNLNIAQYFDRSVNDKFVKHTILKIVEQYEIHPSNIAIKSTRSDRRFTFEKILKSEITVETFKFGCSKLSQISNIPTKLIKANCAIYTENLYYEFNRSLDLGVRTENRKFADITPAYKKS